MEKPRYLPETQRLSILSATILLAYAIARFVNLPVRELSAQLPGLFLSIELNAQNLVSLLVAGITAAGADWLLRDHPSLKKEAKSKRLMEHLLVPGLTALVIGLPLLEVPPGPVWWIGFILAGGLLMLVLVAEYIVVDPDDIRQPIGAATLTAVSFSLYLILAITLSESDLRLSLILPALTIAVWLVSLRTLHLRLRGHWAFLEAGIVALITAQWTAALYYMPLSPVSFGLALTGPAYSITSLIASLSEGKTIRQSYLEPLIVLILVWGVAFWFR